MIGVVVALSGDSQPMSPPLRNEASSSMQEPSDSATASIAIPSSEPSSGHSDDPKESALRLRSAGELGTEVAQWRDATATVISRNGDIVLLQIADVDTEMTSDVVMVRFHGEWTVRHVSKTSGD